MTLENCFGKSRVLLGVVHLPPLPGSPDYGGSMESVIEHALADARALEEGGLDGAVVENFADTPFFPDSVPPETVASMAVGVRKTNGPARILRKSAATPTKNQTASTRYSSASRVLKPPKTTTTVPTKSVPVSTRRSTSVGAM